MPREHTHTIRPARVVSLVALMILVGSTARAEVQSVESRSSSSVHLSAAMASSLAMPAGQPAAETTGLRVRLARRQGADRTARLNRGRWSRPAPKLAPGAGAPAPLTGSATSSHSYGADWYAIAQCESGGVW